MVEKYQVHRNAFIIVDCRRIQTSYQILVRRTLLQYNTTRYVRAYIICHPLPRSSTNPPDQERLSVYQVFYFAHLPTRRPLFVAL